MKRVERKAKAALYTKLVEWSEEDECFVGSAPPIVGRCCHGDDEARVYAELCQIADEWIEIFEKDGRPLPEPFKQEDFSGKFVLRLDPVLHRRLALKALAAGDSLNSFCVKALAKA